MRLRCLLLVLLLFGGCALVLPMTHSGSCLAQSGGGDARLQLTKKEKKLISLGKKLTKSENKVKKWDKKVEKAKSAK